MRDRKMMKAEQKSNLVRKSTTLKTASKDSEEFESKQVKKQQLKNAYKSKTSKY